MAMLRVARVVVLVVVAVVALPNFASACIRNSDGQCINDPDECELRGSDCDRCLSSLSCALCVPDDGSSPDWCTPDTFDGRSACTNAYYPDDEGNAHHTCDINTVRDAATGIAIGYLVLIICCSMGAPLGCCVFIWLFVLKRDMPCTPNKPVGQAPSAQGIAMQPMGAAVATEAGKHVLTLRIHDGRGLKSASAAKATLQFAGNNYETPTVPASSGAPQWGGATFHVVVTADHSRDKLYLTIKSGSGSKLGFAELLVATFADGSQVDQLFTVTSGGSSKGSVRVSGVMSPPMNPAGGYTPSPAVAGGLAPGIPVATGVPVAGAYVQAAPGYGGGGAAAAGGGYPAAGMPAYSTGYPTATSTGMAPVAQYSQYAAPAAAAYPTAAAPAVATGTPIGAYGGAYPTK